MLPQRLASAQSQLCPLLRDVSMCGVTGMPAPLVLCECTEGGSSGRRTVTRRRVVRAVGSKDAQGRERGGKMANAI